MTDDNKSKLALQANSSRQAVDSIRGYVYQIWHSVHAWLGLGRDQYLYIEGAEDFDIMTTGGATAVQTKDISHKITLNSPDVVNAIRNYWSIKEKNPDRLISYKFLTSTDIGVERDTPFGSGVAGLEVWKQCSRDPTKIPVLRTFLSEKSSLPEDMRTTISQMDDQTFLVLIIRPIQWVTAAGDIDHIRKLIDRELILLGEPYGVSATEATRVAARLFREVITTASSKGERSLDRVHLLLLFEAETTKVVPTKHYHELLRAARLDEGSFRQSPSTDAGIRFEVTLSADTSIPPVPANISPRDQLVERLTEKFTSIGVLNLTGSVGTGKTTLAKLIVSRLDKEWYWLTLDGLSPSQVAITLQNTIHLLHTSGTAVSIILDGIGFAPRNLLHYEDHLASILHTIIERGDYFILTSQQPIPQSIIMRLGLTEEIIEKIPHFRLDETIQYTQDLGCQELDLSQAWSSAIIAHTSGHPQLVHARLLNLMARDWPSLSTDDLVKVPDEVVKLRAEARDLLSVLSTDQRELVYRLSILTSFFTRSQAIVIGENPPIIQHPGEVFDSLVGPWVESISNEYYRISPLLVNAANEVWSKERIQTLHVQIAQSIMQSGTVSLIEARSIFFHALLGRDAGVLGSLLIKLIDAPRENWKRISEEFFWLARSGLEPPKMIFPENAHVNFLIRWLQYRIALVVERDIAPQIVEVWDKELAPREPSFVYLGERYIMATTIIISEEAAISPTRLLGYFAEIMEIQEEFQNAGAPPTIREAEDLKIPFQDIADQHSVLGEALFYRCTGRHYLSDLLIGLDKLDKSIHAQLVDILRRNEKLSDVLVTRVWLHEAKQESPDWPACIDVLSSTIERAKQWKITTLGAAAVRGIAIILDEFVKDNQKAIKILGEYTSQLGSHTLIVDAEATVLFNQGRYEDALTIWEKLLPSWNPSQELYDLNPIFSSRNAGIAAFQLGNYELSASFLFEASERSQFMHDKTIPLGLMADAGYAYYKAQDYPKALACLKSVLMEIEEFLDPKENPKEYALKKLVGHTILWIKHALEGSIPDTLFEPTPGMCSNPEYDERILELPDSLLDVTWVLLAEIEYYTGDDVEVFNSVEERMESSSILVARSWLARLRVAQSFKRIELNDLPRKLHSVETYFVTIRKLAGEGRSIVEEIDDIGQYITQVPLVSVLSPDIFVSALFLASRTELPIQPLLSAWRSAVESIPDNETFIKWLDEAEAVYASTTNQILSIMVDPREGRDRQLLAATRAASDVTSLPSHLFYAHISLIENYYYLKVMFSVSLEMPFADLVTEMWREKCKFRAVLSKPQITVPAIEAACASDLQGFQKVAAILLAASDAVQITLSQKQRSMLREFELGSYQNTILDQRAENLLQTML